MIERFRAASPAARIATYGSLAVLIPLAGWFAYALGYQFGFMLGQH
ncbi:MAG: hypothetical protein M3Q88_06975 [Pseudomonadota bacterium]|nr:hypothetical protein [Pseudomonadota bacterium]